MNSFYESYYQILRRVTNEALGGGGPEGPGLPDKPSGPTGKQEAPSGSDPNPNGPQPEQQQKAPQEAISPDALKLANLILSLRNSVGSDKIKTLRLDEFIYNVKKNLSNYAEVRRNVQTLFNTFKNEIGNTSRTSQQQGYEQPAAGKETPKQQNDVKKWLMYAVNSIQNIKNSGDGKRPVNTNLFKDSEVTPENIESFEEVLKSPSEHIG